VMKKNIKLSVFFMLLGWLIITAHQIIPHDHHLGDQTCEKDQKCPLTEDKTDHHKGFPLHCHAFNDLTSEKMVKFVLANYIHFTLYCAGSVSYAFLPATNYVTLNVTDQHIPGFNILTFHSLRAPPSQA
jgi:hypothetical protein